MADEEVSHGSITRILEWASEQQGLLAAALMREDPSEICSLPYYDDLGKTCFSHLAELAKGLRISIEALCSIISVTADLNKECVFLHIRVGDLAGLLSPR